VALPTRKLTPARTRAFVDFAIEMMPKVCLFAMQSIAAAAVFYWAAAVFGLKTGSKQTSSRFRQKRTRRAPCHLSASSRCGFVPRVLV
jgi:hypothetical protein